MVFLCGNDIETAAATAVTNAGNLDEDLCTLVWPNVTDTVGKYLQGFETAAMFAGALCRRGIPNVNFNLLDLETATGVVSLITDIDALISGGVTPIEISDSEVRAVRAVTTSSDPLEQELSVRLNVNIIKRTIQRNLERTYLTSGNTLETRESIKTTVTDILVRYNDNGILTTDERTGTPGYKAPLVETDANDARRVIVTVEIAPTQPLVWIVVNLYVRL
jgi:hypothetical protein